MAFPRLVLRNGELVLPEEAHVSVFNPALYAANGVYESLQVVNGVVFQLEAHLERLRQSAAILDLPLPAPLPALGRWIVEVVQANDAATCALRVLVIGGDSGQASQAFMWPQQAIAYAPALYRRGAPAITFAGERALPNAKSLNTLVTSLARQQAQRMGAHEALLHHDSRLTEGSNSNLFAVIEGAVLTPPGDEVLHGVTRDLLLELAQERGLPVHEAPLLIDGIPLWEECFITSTSRHVMPVTSIDGRRVGSGEPGPLTRSLAAVFEEFFERNTRKLPVALLPEAASRTTHPSLGEQAAGG